MSTHRATKGAGPWLSFCYATSATPSLLLCSFIGSRRGGGGGGGGGGRGGGGGGGRGRGRSINYMFAHLDKNLGAAASLAPPVPAPMHVAML